jgi:hypothetical protein
VRTVTAHANLHYQAGMLPMKRRLSVSWWNNFTAHCIPVINEGKIVPLWDTRWEYVCLRQAPWNSFPSFPHRTLRYFLLHKVCKW